MDSILRREDATFDLGRALNGRVRVQLDHGRAGRHRFRAVDLDLEVALGGGKFRQEREKSPSEEHVQRGAQCHQALSYASPSAFFDVIPHGPSSPEIRTAILDQRALESMMRIGDLTRRRGQAMVPAWPPQVWTSAGSVFHPGPLGRAQLGPADTRPRIW